MRSPAQLWGQWRRIRRLRRFMEDKVGLSQAEATEVLWGRPGPLQQVKSAWSVAWFVTIVFAAFTIAGAVNLLIYILEGT